jgi:hypothetical protein
MNTYNLPNKEHVLRPFHFRPLRIEYVEAATITDNAITHAFATATAIQAAATGAKRDVTAFTNGLLPLPFRHFSHYRAKPWEGGGKILELRVPSKDHKPCGHNFVYSSAPIVCEAICAAPSAPRATF